MVYSETLERDGIVYVLKISEKSGSNFQVNKSTRPGKSWGSIFVLGFLPTAG